jgi:acyl-CoA thioesterase FadM
VVSIKAIGKSSITTLFECFGADGLRVSSNLKFVIVDHMMNRTVPIPLDLQSRLEQFQHGSEREPESASFPVSAPHS